MLKMALFLLALTLSACAASRNAQLQPFYQDMESKRGVLTLDDALTRWGQPAQKTEGDAILMCTWGAAQDLAVGVPLGQLVVAAPVSHGWRLDIVFDKKTRTMNDWSYREW